MVLEWCEPVEWALRINNSKAKLEKKKCVRTSDWNTHTRKIINARRNGAIKTTKINFNYRVGGWNESAGQGGGGMRGGRGGLRCLRIIWDCVNAVSTGTNGGITWHAAINRGRERRKPTWTAEWIPLGRHISKGPLMACCCRCHAHFLMFRSLRLEWSTQLHTDV